MPSTNSTITAANAVATLTVSGVFSAPQTLSGFSADNIFDTPDLVANETMMGVDGRLSGGYVYAPVPQTWTFMADSTSNDIFDAWYAAMKTNKDTYIASGIITLKSLSMQYTLKRGFLTSYSPAPAAAKVLQPRRYTITWQSITGAAI